MASILIIEDDEAIAELERDYLEMAGHAVRIERDGRTGLTLALSGDFDLVLLDVMLPGMSGLEICRAIRAALDIPILMCTARTTDFDAVRGLELGADDYIKKPFSPAELAARVEAHLERYARLKGIAGTGEVICAGPIRIDVDGWCAEVQGRQVELRAKEFELLLLMARNPGVVFSRAELYQRVWGIDGTGDDSTVTVHIKRLRAKIEDDPAHPQVIQTVRGAGYKLVPGA